MILEIRPAGDRGSLIEVADNATAVQLARVLRAKHPELVDVVVGHRTVLVTWEDGIRDLGDLVLAPKPDAAGRRVEIPVVYDGPDLDEVAALTGLSPEAVIVLHTGSEHVAAFLGFQPGFAYLTGGDERLHVPRREVPRTLVPGGAVAIAGPYSGVYPRDSPGGWRLLGSTTTSMFDPSRDQPALLAPGDRVRFVAV